MELVISPAEAAKLSGIGINRLRELSKRQDFPAFRDGRKILILKAEFADWLRQQAVDKVGFGAPLRRWRRSK